MREHGEPSDHPGDDAGYDAGDETGDNARRASRRPDANGPFADPFEDEAFELIRPEDFLGPSGIPADARRMGFDRNTEEGALIALAGRLDPAKLSHKVVAWVLILAFAIPLMLGLVRLQY